MATVKHDLETVLSAISGSGGIKTVIAQRLGVSRWTVDNYLEKWASAKQAYENEEDINLDIAESVLTTNIRIAHKLQTQTGVPQDTADAKWYLSRKGKRRGYVERSEVTGADGGPLVIEYVNDWRNAE
jgi:hypothetical protein